MRKARMAIEDGLKERGKKNSKGGGKDDY